MIRYGSVCSGVEAATLAWKPLGWECVFVSEVEPFPCAVLQHRLGASRPIHPLDPAETEDEKDAAERRAWMKQNEKLRADGVIPNEGDFTKIGDKYRGKIDLLVGGTPCFPAGNLVLTDFGYKPIEEIKVGDRVISHLDRLCRVVRTGSKIADNVGIMKATNNVDDIFISATANHPFLVGNSESFALVDAEFKPIAECVGKNKNNKIVYDFPSIQSARDNGHSSVSYSIRKNTFTREGVKWELQNMVEEDTDA